MKHYHKTEFKCRKCGYEQEILLECGEPFEEVPCDLCRTKDMWVGHYEDDEPKMPDGSILSPIQPIII